MSVLDKKLLRDIFHSKGMLAAIIAIIAVGAGCLVGAIGTLDNLMNAKNDYYSGCRMADFWIDIRKAPVSEVNRLCAVDGVSEIRTRVSFPVVADIPGVAAPISGQALSLPPERSGRVVNDVVLRSGSYFTPCRKEEVIVSEKFSEIYGMKPGTFISLVMNGQQKSLFVVGTAISSEYMYMTPPGGIVPDPASFGVFWLKQDFAEEVFGFQGACNSIVGILDPAARENPRPVLDRLSSRLSDYGVFTSIPLKDQMSNLNIVSEFHGLTIMAIFLPTVFLGVAAMVLNVVMIRMAEQQRTIIGTLKALGVCNRDVFAHFLKFGLFVGLCGGLLGCACGYWISSEMTAMYDGIYTFPSLTNKLYPETMAFAVTVALLFAVVGTVHGVRNVIRLEPAEAMRPPPPQSCGKIFIEDFAIVWNRLGFMWQVVLRSLFRNKGRTAIGMTASAMGSAILFMSLGLSDSMGYLVTFQFEKVLLCDYGLNLRDEADEGACLEARRLPGVTRAEPLLEVPCTLANGSKSRKSCITGISGGAKLTVPRDKDGAAVAVPATGFLMTRRLAEMLGLSAGDTVAFTPVKGERKTSDAKVAGIVDSVFGLSVYADYGYLNRLVGENGAVSSLQLSARQTPEEKARFMAEVKRYPKLASLSATGMQKESMLEDFIAKLNGMIFVMIIFAGVIFFGSILNSSLISIAERQREIATLRVLGYHPLEIGSMFLKEIVVINAAGAIIGLPLGYVLTRGMCAMFCNEMYSFICFVKPSTWLLSTALALAFIVSAWLIIQWVLTRLEWGEALKMKE